MDIEIVKKLFGKNLLKAMNDMLKEFKQCNFDIDLITSSLKEVNESVRTGLYLLALDKNYNDLAFKINEANKRLNDDRRFGFIDAVKNNEVDKFLALLGKSDKISLMNDLGLNVDSKGKSKFTKEQKEYYDILYKSIYESQELDKRDGIDKFIKYKKEDK